MPEKMSHTADKGKGGRTIGVQSRPMFSIGSAWHQGTHHYERPASNTSWILSCILRGRVQITTADGVTASSGFCLRLIKPNLAYRVDSMNGASYWCVFSHQQMWESYFNWPQALPGIMYLDVHDQAMRHQIKQLMEQTQQFSRACHPQASRLVRNTIERLLLISDAINPSSNRTLPDERLQQAMTYIGSHLHRPFSAQQLARHIHLSTSRLSTLFREHLGQSPGAFHDRSRMNEAAELLRHSGASIKQIASNLGFANPYHFSKRFKHWHGLSPRQFRQS